MSELTDEASSRLLSRTLAVCCTSDKTAEKSMELASKLINAILKTLPAFYGHRSSKDAHPPWVFENQWKAHGEALESLLWLIGCGIVVSPVAPKGASVCTCETVPDVRTVLCRPRRMPSTDSQPGRNRPTSSTTISPRSSSWISSIYSRASRDASFPTTSGAR